MATHLDVKMSPPRPLPCPPNMSVEGNIGGPPNEGVLPKVDLAPNEGGEPKDCPTRSNVCVHDVHVCTLHVCVV